MKKKKDSIFNYLPFTDFFDLFIALSYIIGDRNINFNYLRDYLKEYCDSNKEILDELEKKVKEFEEKNIINLRDNKLIINDTIPLKELVLNKGYYLENVLKIIHDYQVYDSKMASNVMQEDWLEMDNEKTSNQMLRKMEAYYGYHGKTR